MFNSFAQPKQRLNANEHKDSIKPLLSAQAFCVWTYFFSKDPLENEIIVKIDPRKNSNARCSECGTTSPIYDTLKKPRRFEFIPMWGYLIFFLYCPRRVSCKKCKKVKVEELPWANKGSSITKPYKVYLAMWAKRMSWKETAEAFQSTWHHVYESVKSVVEYGLENRTQKQKLKLKDILEYDLKSVRAFLLKESFQLFWNYSSPYWAAWYLDIWCKRAMRSRLEPFKKFAKSMRRHQPLILNYFKAKKQFSSGVVEPKNGSRKGK